MGRSHEEHRQEGLTVGTEWYKPAVTRLGETWNILVSFKGILRASTSAQFVIAKETGGEVDTVQIDSLLADRLEKPSSVGGRGTEKYRIPCRFCR